MVKFNSVTHKELENEVLKTALPDLGNFETFGGSNYTNYAQFDLLLFHISTSQTINTNYVPSKFSLYILMTLASRCPNINYVKNDPDSSHRLHMDQLLLQNQVTIPSLHTRANEILRLYNQGMSLQFQNHQAIESMELYIELRNIFLGFIGTKIKTQVKKPKIAEPIETIDEPENILQTQPGTDDYQQRFDELKAQIDNVSKEMVPQKKPSRKGVFKPIDINGTLVFDENLITYKLNSQLNEYNLRDLIRWAFSCAPKADRYSKNIVERHFHDIYSCQIEFLKWVIDFFRIDLNALRLELENSPKEFEKKVKQYFGHELKDQGSDASFFKPIPVPSEEVILFKIFKSSFTNHFQEFLDIVFYGLRPSQSNGRYCYERENQLVWGYHDNYDNTKSKVDIYDSFDLRYKLSITMFESLSYLSPYSMIRRSRSEGKLTKDAEMDSHQIETMMSTNVHLRFIRWLSKRLLGLEFNYIKTFFNLITNDIYTSNFPMINSEFLLYLCADILENYGVSLHMQLHKSLCLIFTLEQNYANCELILDDLSDYLSYEADFAISRRLSEEHLKYDRPGSGIYDGDDAESSVEDIHKGWCIINFVMSLIIEFHIRWLTYASKESARCRAFIEVLLETVEKYETGLELPCDHTKEAARRKYMFPDRGEKHLSSLVYSYWQQEK